MQLTAENVHNTLMECLFHDGEDTSAHIIGEGIQKKVGFHPERLESHRDNITAMLNELPEPFHAATGGGWTFLNACNDKNGNQWTGLHATVDELVMLGNAIGKLKFLMPREMWSMFPGGMPYMVIN